MKRKVKHDILIIIGALIVLGGIFLFSHRTKEADTLPPATIEEVGGLIQGYRNDEFGIDIEYPELWHGSEQVAGVVVKFVPNDYDFFDFRAPSVSVAVNNQLDDAEKRLTLNQLADANIEKLRGILDEMKIEKDDMITINLQPARKIVYTATLGSFTTKIMEVKILNNDRLYTLTYGSLPKEYDRYEKVAQEIIGSFRTE